MTQNSPAISPDQINDSVTGGLPQFIKQNPILARCLCIGLIVLLTLLAYIPAMRAGFIWDDNYYVTHNKLLTSFEGLSRIWFDVLPSPAEYPLPQYYPLTFTSFWLEYHLWGLHPAGFHIVNILLHAISSLMIWQILKKLSVPGAWLAAAIFAVHPINVESVAWVAERKNVLSLVFYLGSLYLMLRAAGVIAGEAIETSETASNENATQLELIALPDDPTRLYTLAVFAFFCALLSKSIAISMPFVALLIIWWKRRKITRDDLLRTLPLIIVGGAFSMLTAYMEKVRVGVGAHPQEWTYAPTELGNFGGRCIIAGRAAWFYLGKVFWPHPLIFNYPRWQILPEQPLQYLWPVTMVLLVLALWIARRRITRGPIIALLFYLITLFPAMGFFNVWPMRYSFVADHFSYIPVIAPIALLAAVMVRYLHRSVLMIVAVLLLIVFFQISFSQAGIYENNYKLWTTTWKSSDKQSWMAANNAGVELMEIGQLDAAEKWFNAALDLDKNYLEPRINLGRIAVTRGNEMQHGPTSAPYYQQAKDYFNQAVAIDPSSVDARYLLGRLLIRTGEKEAGIAQMKQVVSMYPKHESAYETLGELALSDGQTDQARDYFADAVLANPDSPDAHELLGNMLLDKGMIVDGLGQWDLATSLAPRDVEMLNRFGVRMFQAGNYQKAIDYFKRALLIDSNSPKSLTNLGMSAARLGFADQARDRLQDALRVDPGFQPAIDGLEALRRGNIVPASRPTTGQ